MSAPPSQSTEKIVSGLLNFTANQHRLRDEMNGDASPEFVL